MTEPHKTNIDLVYMASIRSLRDRTRDNTLPELPSDNGYVKADIEYHGANGIEGTYTEDGHDNQIGILLRRHIRPHHVRHLRGNERMHPNAYYPIHIPFIQNEDG